MTNLITLELTTLKAEELRTIAKEYQMVGAWKAKKDEMIKFLEEIKSQQIKEAEEAAVQEEEVKPESKPKRGRTRVIEVYKDGELITTIEGLMETFKWVTENQITNVGWVKRSLKTGEETNAGYKYKTGGYKFVYAN